MNDFHLNRRCCHRTSACTRRRLLLVVVLLLSLSLSMTISMIIPIPIPKTTTRIPTTTIKQSVRVHTNSELRLYIDNSNTENDNDIITKFSPIDQQQQQQQQQPILSPSMPAYNYDASSTTAVDVTTTINGTINNGNQQRQDRITSNNDSLDDFEWNETRKQIHTDQNTTNGSTLSSSQPFHSSFGSNPNHTATSTDTSTDDVHNKKPVSISDHDNYQPMMLNVTTDGCSQGDNTNLFKQQQQQQHEQDVDVLEEIEPYRLGLYPYLKKKNTNSTHTKLVQDNNITTPTPSTASNNSSSFSSTSSIMKVSVEFEPYRLGMHPYPYSNKSNNTTSATSTGSTSITSTTSTSSKKINKLKTVAVNWLSTKTTTNNDNFIQTSTHVEPLSPRWGRRSSNMNSFNHVRQMLQKRLSGHSIIESIFGTGTTGSSTNTLPVDVPVLSPTAVSPYIVVPEIINNNKSSPQSSVSVIVIDNNSQTGIIRSNTSSTVVPTTATVIRNKTQSTFSNHNPFAEFQKNMGFITMPSSVSSSVSSLSSSNNNNGSINTTTPIYRPLPVIGNNNDTIQSISSTTTQPTNMLYFFPTNNSVDPLWKLGNEGIEAAYNALSSLPFATIILTPNGTTTTSNVTTTMPDGIDLSELLGNYSNYIGNYTNYIGNYSNYTAESVMNNFVKPLFDMSADAVATMNTATGTSSKQQQQQQQQSDAIVVALEKIVRRKHPNDVLTVADLQSILQEKDKRRSTSITPKRKDQIALVDENNPNSLISNNKKLGSSSASSKGNLVAFPQASILSYRNIKTGSVVSAGCLGILVGISILPQLWLIGAIIGAAYGYDTGTKYSQYFDAINTNNNKNSLTQDLNIVQQLVLSLSRRLMKRYLLLYDYWQGMFFMYKTGQLSYEYYKTYAALDQKFGVQSKIDSWNARFAEGKINFDKWEKENEVGRKVLATLRTVWLVEERSLKKQQARIQKGLQTKSKYRLVQLMYDIAYSIRQYVQKTIQTFNPKDVVDLLYGIGISINQNTIRLRISASIGAGIAAAVFGSLFTISPQLVVVLCIVYGGIIWPSWISELYFRTTSYLDDTRARGRSFDGTGSSGGSGKKQQQQPRRQPYNPPPLLFWWPPTSPTRTNTVSKKSMYHTDSTIHNRNENNRYLMSNNNKYQKQQHLHQRSNYNNNVKFYFPWETPIPVKQPNWFQRRFMMR